MWKLIVSILICLLVGFIGSLFTMSSVDTWYATIEKPAFSPPNWLFAPVWTVLYILMGVALYFLILKKAKPLLVLFGTQLALNLIWSILFFGLHSPLLAVIDLFALLYVILLIAEDAYKTDKRVTYLFVPYILWVTFALALNLSIWWLNR